MPECISALDPKKSLKLRIPKISPKFEKAITTAIPRVKPITIEFGINLTYLPIPKIPDSNNITPAMIETKTNNPCAWAAVPPLSIPYL